jgi:hypothetical protein
MNKSVLIILAALIFVLGIQACKSDSEEQPEPVYTEVQQLLMRNTWKLSGRVWVNGRPSTFELPECRQDDYVKYISGDSFTRFLGPQICVFDTFFKPPSANFFWKLEEGETVFIQETVLHEMDTTLLVIIDSNSYISRTIQPDGTTMVDMEYVNVP